jgi:hypothetical protein
VKYKKVVQIQAEFCRTCVHKEKCRSCYVLGFAKEIADYVIQEQKRKIQHKGGLAMINMRDGCGGC